MLGLIEMNYLSEIIYRCTLVKLRNIFMLRIMKLKFLFEWDDELIEFTATALVQNFFNSQG